MASTGPSPCAPASGRSNDRPIKIGDRLVADHLQNLPVTEREIRAVMEALGEDLARLFEE